MITNLQELLIWGLQPDNFTQFAFAAAAHDESRTRVLAGDLLLGRNLLNSDNFRGSGTERILRNLAPDVWQRYLSAVRRRQELWSSIPKQLKLAVIMDDGYDVFTKKCGKYDGCSGMRIIEFRGRSIFHNLVNRCAKSTWKAVRYMTLSDEGTISALIRQAVEDSTVFSGEPCTRCTNRISSTFRKVVLTTHRAMPTRI